MNLIGKLLTTTAGTTAGTAAGTGALGEAISTIFRLPVTIIESMINATPIFAWVVGAFAIVGAVMTVKEIINLIKGYRRYR